MERVEFSDLKQPLSLAIDLKKDDEGQIDITIYDSASGDNTYYLSIEQVKILKDVLITIIETNK
jgi:hypothetical protein